MVQFLQLERTTDGIINQDANVIFDTAPIAIGGDDISYNSGTGVITFHQEGVYYVNWFVAQQTSQATDGSNFAIITTAGEFAASASNHIKVSQTSGFAIINVDSADETARLVNLSNAAAALSETVQVTAGLSVFSVADQGDEPTPPAGAPLGYMQAQVSNGPVAVGGNQYVDFDHVIVQDPNGIITKQNGIGRFILGEAGTYLVTWEIPVEGTEVSLDVDFTLELEGDPYSSAYMPLAIGVLSGSAMVVTSTDDEEMQIINTSGNDVMVSNKANIVITQITKAEATPEADAA